MRPHGLYAFALLAALASCQGAPQPGEESAPVGEVAAASHTCGSPETVPGFPFSYARRIGDTLYLSGQVGVLPGTTTLVPGGIGPETRQTLENIKQVLEENGSSLDRVVKCTVMVQDIATNFGPMNSVYAEFFSEPYPARSSFGAAGLALGAKVEIECIARVKRSCSGGGHGHGHDDD